MRPARSLLRRTSARERDAAGVTLVELLIYSGLLLLVITAALSSLESVTNAQAFQVDRSESLTSMRITLNRMTKELRQATEVDTAASSSSAITFTTYVGGVTHTLTYRASGTVLTRAIDGGTAISVLNHIASTSLFTTVAGSTAADIQWVRISLRVTATKGADTVLALDSEVNLRNNHSTSGTST